MAAIKPLCRYNSLHFVLLHLNVCVQIRVCRKEECLFLQEKPFVSESVISSFRTRSCC